jgi:hypothetical protein
MGKSRMADRCSESILAVTFVLRPITANNSYSYPPGDAEVLEFFQKTPPVRPLYETPEKWFTEIDRATRVQVIWTHAQVVALLLVTFETCEFSMSNHIHSECRHLQSWAKLTSPLLNSRV